MKRCSVLFVVLSLLFGLSACQSEYPIPTEYPIPSEGVWYCAELQAQFTRRKTGGFVSPYDEDDEYFVDESKNYVIVNGDRIATGLESDRGASYVWITCQEPDHPDFYEGEIIYSFDFVSLSDTEYILKDDAGKRYTFLRIGDTPTDG